MNQTRYVDANFHDRRTILFSELCRVSSEKPIILKHCAIHSTIRHSITIVACYKGNPIDTIPMVLTPGINPIPFSDVTRIFLTRNWSSIELISDVIRRNSEEPYTLRLEFSLCNPIHSLDAIQAFAQRVHDNSSLKNNFIAYLLQDL